MLLYIFRWDLKSLSPNRAQLPQSSSRGSLRQSATEGRQWDKPSPPSLNPCILLGKPALPPLPAPVYLHPQTQQESKLLLAAKENISESHKRFLFIFYFLFLKTELSVCLSLHGWPREAGWGGRAIGVRLSPEPLGYLPLRPAPNLGPAISLFPSLGVLPHP